MGKKKFHWIKQKIGKTPVQTACGRTVTAYGSYMTITPPYTTQENEERVTCKACRQVLGWSDANGK